MINHPDTMFTRQIISQFSYDVWEKITEETKYCGIAEV